MTLSVENLSINFRNKPILNDISFQLRPGTTTALIGESGSGKSLTGLAVMGLLPEDVYVSDGAIKLNELNLVDLSEKQLGKIRGSRIAMVFQDSLSALNPVHTIGRQLLESFRIHGGPSGVQARKRVIELLEMVQIPEPSKRLKSYPHQLSGGQRQRVAIAMALAGEPEVLIADEPTTALDVRVQASIVSLLSSIVQNTNTSLLFITHDLPVAAELCDEVLVMYGGKVVEAGSTRSTLVKPYHPYTDGLVGATPSEKWELHGNDRLPTIPGSVPPLDKFPSGCPFRDRCHRADDKCIEMPQLEILPTRNTSEVRQVACWNDLAGVK